MKTFILFATVATLFAGQAFAEDAAPAPKTNRMALCGQAWKAEKAKPGFVVPVKGEGGKAWNTFRKEHCAKGMTITAN